MAILSSAAFEASAVDASTLSFGPAAAVPVHRPCRHLEDVDSDGLIDLLSHYRASETGLEPGDEAACIRGSTLDGLPITGCDAITLLDP